jgi:3-dehydrosphinganine reductase
MTRQAVTSAWQGRHVIITGGAGSLGRAIGEQLAAAGARVSLIGRDDGRLLRAVEEVTTGIWPVRTAVADVVDRDALARAIRSLEAVQGRYCDVLITCAGSPHPGTVDELVEGDYQAQMSVHFDGTRHAIDGVLPAMLDRADGTIVTVSSAQIFHPRPGLSAHVAAKAAVFGLASSLRGELRPRGVHVACVFPGALANRHQEFEAVLSGADATSVRGIPTWAAAHAVIRGIDRRKDQIFCDWRTRARIGPHLSRIRVPLLRRSLG